MRNDKNIDLCIVGDVVPVGGTRESETGRLALVPGDAFIEPMSSRMVQVNGGYLADAEVVPSSGGFQTLLDSSMLACEARVLDVIRGYKDNLAG